MTSDPQLIKDWIQYLKNNQIAAMQSDTKTGKLKYRKPVTTYDLHNFLNTTGKYSSEQITNAIDTVVSKKLQNNIPAPNPTQSRQLSQTPDAIRKRQQRAALSQKSKTGNAVIGNMVKQLQKPDNTIEKPIRQKPRFTYRGINEDIGDANTVELSEKDVEEIFSLLSAPAAPTLQAKPDDSIDKKQESIKKIKKLVRDGMTPQQRKSLWRALTESNNISESEINRADVKAILQGASDLRSNPSFLSKMAGLKKDKIDVNDLQKIWKDEGFPDDTRDIYAILKSQGFADKEINKVFSQVFDNEENDDEYNEPKASPAIQKIADYAKKIGITDDLIKFMKNEFSDELELSNNTGLANKVWDAGKKLYKKAVAEEIRQIFTAIIHEDRITRIENIKQIQQTHLGRTKK